MLYALYVKNSPYVAALITPAQYNNLPVMEQTSWVLVDDGAKIGARLVDGTWQVPGEPAANPTTVVEAGYSLTQVDRATFKLLMTIFEEDAINRVSEVYPPIKILVGRLNDAANVNLELGPVLSALDMLASVPGTLLVQSRIANIKAGKYPTSDEVFQSMLRHVYYYGDGTQDNPAHNAPMPE